MEGALERAQLLLQQKKYAEAERSLTGLLGQESDNYLAMAMLAQCKLHQGKYDEAENLINQSIALHPDAGFLFYIKGQIAAYKDDYESAEMFVQQAISLDPFDEDNYSLLASILLDRKKYDEALKYADKALEINAQDVTALNVRTKALIKLDKKGDAFQTIEGALREDPNNAYTHANYGWALLEKGSSKKALEHFKESLMIDPTSGYAQEGMKEGLKATNFIYRLFLKYAFMMSKLTSKYQWGVIIGLYILMRALSKLASHNEQLAPYLTPIVYLLILFAFSTWIITPVSNLFLRLNKYGKHLLSKKEKMNSNFVGLSFLIFIIGLTVYFITKNDAFIVLSAVFFLMMVPYGKMFDESTQKNIYLIYAVIMTLAGIASFVVAFASGTIFNGFSFVFLFGFIAYQWIVNYIQIKASNR